MSPLQGATYLATDELEITGTLCIAVTRTVLGTSGVCGVAAHTTIGLHGDEVESAVDTALNRREIHVEGELIARQSEHLVSFLVLHEVETGSNIGSVLMLSHKFQGKRIATGGSTIGGAVGGTLNCAVLCTVGVARADGSPSVAIVAVLIATDYK